MAATVSSAVVVARRVSVDGLGLNVLDTAPGDDARPVVVGVHGIPERAASWRRVAESLAPRARVILPDLPGFGESDKPADFDYALPSLSAAFGEAIDQLVPERAVHLAVHDIGGPVGLLWALRAPERVASLLILNTTVFLEHFRPPAPALIAQIPLLGQRALAGAMRDADRLRAKVLSGARRPIPPEALDELLAPYRKEDARRAAARTWAGYRRSARVFWRARRSLGELTMPTSVVFGERDPYCPPANAHKFAAAIPGATVRLIADCGHFVPSEAPEEIVAELEAQLQEVRG